MTDVIDKSLLGKLFTSQSTIDDEIDLKKISKIFSDNIDFIDQILQKKNDEYANKLFDNFKKDGFFNFPINKHIELFILKNSINIEKITNYIIFRYKFFIAGKEKINLGYPPYLLIEPVSTCNLRCPFCFQTDKSFTKKPFMGVIDFDFFKKVVDEADQLEIGAITLASRGEPTLHKNFVELVEYVGNKKNIFELKINTNGTFLNEAICHSFFKNNVTQVVVSSDHYIKKDYERLRLGSNFEKVVKNVDLLFSIRKNFYPNSLTEIRISGVDNERNLDRKKFKEFWIKRSDHVTAGFPLERWNTYENKIHPDIIDPCENLWDRMYVWFDGKVNPCDADYKSNLSYGDLGKYSIKEIWNNKIAEKLRSEHLGNERLKTEPCDRCGVTYI